MFLQRSRFPLVVFSFPDTVVHWVVENGILKRTYLWGLVSYNDQLIHGQMYNANIYIYIYILYIYIYIYIYKRMTIDFKYHFILDLEC
jgi:hypothetical protein